MSILDIFKAKKETRVWSSDETTRIIDRLIDLSKKMDSTIEKLQAELKRRED